MSTKSDAERVELTTKGLRNLRQFALENGHQEAAQLLGLADGRALAREDRIKQKRAKFKVLPSKRHGA